MCFFIIFYIFSTRERAFYILLVHTTESLFNQLTKMIYRSSRPYFYQERGMKIFGSCAMTYGNPSGHASFSAAIYVTLFLMIFHDRDHRVEERVVRLSINQGASGSVVVDHGSTNQFKWFQFTKNRWAQAIGFLIAAFMMFGIGISRFMLGAHSIDQVIYGWSFGLWFAFFFFRYVRPRVQIHLSRLLESNQDHLSIHDQSALKG